MLVGHVGHVPVTEQGVEKVQHVRPRFFHRLLPAVGHVHAGPQDHVIGCDSVAVLGEALGVEADHVLSYRQGGVGPGGYGDVLSPGPLDGLFADRHRHPDRRTGLLHRPRPDRHVGVTPEIPFVRKYLFRPGQLDDFPGLLEAGSGFSLVYAVGNVFPGDSPDKSRDQAAVGKTVQHRQFFRQP